MSYDIDTCRSCQARIIWTVTTGGKDMPVDAEPATDGTIQLVDRRHLGLKPQARVLKVADRFGKTRLRLSHFVSCPQAGQWRTKRPTEPVADVERGQLLDAVVAERFGSEARRSG